MTIFSPTQFKTLVFDCDGVILNSNRVKTEAFRQAALPYGAPAAQALVDYHVARGGISRFEKFRHFLNVIAPELAPATIGPGNDELLATYADAVENGLMACEIAPGLAELRAATPGIPWMIVSGGAQNELRDIFARRDIAQYFDGGIFGSPDSKDKILAREIASGHLQRPALFIGDSRYDHEAATVAGLDFLFVSRWSEFHAWQAYSTEHGFPAIESLHILADAG